MSRRGGFFVVGSWILLCLVFPKPILAAPIISQISAGTQATKFEKFEITFQVQSSTVSNTFFPLDQSPPPGLTANTGITVNAIFTDPQGTTYTQPAFYYQEFQDQVKNGDEWFYPTNNFSWKVRFSPNKEGMWHYKLQVTDASGFIEYVPTPDSFIVTSSSNKGFLKVSPDPRYFEYDDGTYFPALGFNLNGGGLDNVNPVLGNTSEFQAMSANGMDLTRVWISQFSIYGEAYGKWGSPNRVHQTQEPRYGIVNPISDQFARYPSLISPQLPQGSEYYMWLNFDATTETNGDQLYLTPCRYLSQIPVKQNTNYRVRVRYKDIGIEGPKVAGQPFGFAVKTSSTSLANATSLCNEPTAGTVVAATYNPASVSVDPQNSNWLILTGTFSSGIQDFINQFYLTFNNAQSQDSDQSAGHVFVDQVWLEEASCAANCANLLSKPWMSMHQYINQRDAYSFDKLLTLAKQYNIFLKSVMLEKNDRIFQTIGFNGQPVSSQSVDNFYGNGRTLTKTRWLQQAWWRYMQARWGYSPNIHSWELLNEGGSSTNHLAQADEFGKYMKCRVFGQQPVADAIAGNVCRHDHPNAHLVTTSFFGGMYPWRFWNNSDKLYADLDYADQHLYANQSDPNQTQSYWDSALFSYQLSTLFNNFGPGNVKPFIRGETAWNFPGVDYFGTNADGGVWLHDFIWAGVNNGGLMEQFFAGGNYTKHIYNISGSTVLYDHRPMFKPFYDFIKNIPLNNGNYLDANAATSSAQMRAWGQKDLVNNRAHLWIQNVRHTWCTVIGTVPGCPQAAWSTLTSTQQRLTGTVFIGGFTPNMTFPIQWWQFDEFANNIATPTAIITTNALGQIILDLDQLPATVVDTGVKIGNYTNAVSFVDLLTNWFTSRFDQTGDGIVNSLDFASLLP